MMIMNIGHIFPILSTSWILISKQCWKLWYTTLNRNELTYKHVWNIIHVLHTFQNVCKLAAEIFHDLGPGNKNTGPKDKIQQNEVICPALFQEKATRFGEDFKTAGFREDVTPYIHGKYSDITSCKFVRTKANVCPIASALTDCLSSWQDMASRLCVDYVYPECAGISFNPFVWPDPARATVFRRAKVSSNDSPHLDSNPQNSGYMSGALLTELHPSPIWQSIFHR